jgi:DNA-binding winged helix-turn-helix (wHTH) protein
MNRQGDGSFSCFPWRGGQDVMPSSQIRTEVLPQIKEAAGRLPSPDTKRWVRQRKAMVVDAVRSGAVSLEEVCRRYELTVEEFVSWQRALDGGAHIQATVRRFDDRSKSTIRTGRLAVNLETRVVSVDDQPVHLSSKEYRILELLSWRKGATLTKEMLLNHLYAGLPEPASRIVDVLVCRLRKKLAQATGGTHYIGTAWGHGYVLREAAVMPTTTPVTDLEDLDACRGEAGTRAGAGGGARACRPDLQVAAQPRQTQRQRRARNWWIGQARRSRISSGTKPTDVAFPVEFRFEDADTDDGGPLRVLRPDPVTSLSGVRRRGATNNLAPPRTLRSP